MLLFFVVGCIHCCIVPQVVIGVVASVIARGVDVMSMWCRCDVHVMSMWCRCDVDVMSMWCRCDVDVMPMWCRCDVDVMSMGCRCDVYVMSMWCRCDTDVMSPLLSVVMSMCCRCDVDMMLMWCRCDVLSLVMSMWCRCYGDAFYYAVGIYFELTAMSFFIHFRSSCFQGETRSRVIFFRVLSPSTTDIMFGDVNPSTKFY